MLHLCDQTATEGKEGEKTGQRKSRKAACIRFAEVHPSVSGIHYYILYVPSLKRHQRETNSTGGTNLAGSVHHLALNKNSRSSNDLLQLYVLYHDHKVSPWCGAPFPESLLEGGLVHALTNGGKLAQKVTEP